MDAADESGAEIIPVDSEHSAIFQCLQGSADKREIKRLILTCSGGPFYGQTREEVALKTRADALKHPNWKMGPKITVDCSTLMNKGLEVIEAMRLYRLPLEQVDVVIHRQSIVHSFVEYRDGAVLAQLGTPDMRLPIRYAMTYPRRGENPAEPLDLLTCPPLTFAAPDREVFPCLRLAEEAATEGGTACAILNAANEEAVRLFLEDKIGFYDISRLVSEARGNIPVIQNPSLEEILAADAAARRSVLGK
jgi:1-deoxy-D-xylulose-5-phosphate reductoisomerase